MHPTPLHPTLAAPSGQVEAGQESVPSAVFAPGCEIARGRDDGRDVVVLAAGAVDARKQE
jgi:hypothetical protein